MASTIVKDKQEKLQFSLEGRVLFAAIQKPFSADGSEPQYKIKIAFDKTTEGGKKFIQNAASLLPEDKVKRILQDEEFGKFRPLSEKEQGKLP